MKIGGVNLYKIPKVQYYVLIIGLFTTFAWWLRTVFILDDDNDEVDLMNTKISTKQYYALIISLVLSVIGWIETVFLFNSIKCSK